MGNGSFCGIHAIPKRTIFFGGGGEGIFVPIINPFKPVDKIESVLE